MLEEDANEVHTELTIGLLHSLPLVRLNLSHWLPDCPLHDGVGHHAPHLSSCIHRVIVRTLHHCCCSPLMPGGAEGRQGF